jgi:ATP-dependent Clp protease, proteolytic subunit ClpP
VLFIFAKNLQTKMTNSSIFNTIPGDGEVAILLYGNVGAKQQVDSERVVSELLALEKMYNKIDVRINSTGGDVFSGMAIFNALRNSKANITMYIDGVAASIAGIIALCGKPLYMSPYAKLMLHAVSAGAYGKASELRETATLVESLQNDLASMIAGRLGQNKEEIVAKYFDEKDHWISAQEALEMKLIDGIYDMKGEDVKASTTEEIYNYFNNRLEKPLNDNEMTLKDHLKSVASFANLADDNAILAHINELENAATKVEALENAVNTYKEKLAVLEQKEITSFIDKAIAEGKITNEQKESFTNLMKSDRKNTEALINSMKANPFVKASSVFAPENKGAENIANKSWDELDQAGELATLRAASPETFKAKYKEKFGIDYKE